MFFLYPGFGKTGTTTLQEHLLSRHKDIIYFGRPFTYSESISEFNREIRKPEGYFDGQKFKKLSESCRNEAKEGKTAIISDATLINNYYMRGILAKRLHDAFPDAYIIFTIRNQLSAVKSYYANHGRLLRKVPAPFTGRYVSFDNWLSYSLQTWETSYPGLIDYSSSLRIYEKIFGKEKVKVFLFEEFVKNKKKFIDTLSRHLSINSDEAFYLIEGKKSNPRDSGALIKWISIRQKLFPGISIRQLIPGGRWLQNIFYTLVRKGKKLEVHLSKEWKDTLTERYGPGNRLLVSNYNLPLEKYEYPL